MMSYCVFLVCKPIWFTSKYLIQGLSADHVFGHHGKAYSNNMITIYDEYYNRRERPGNQKFPDRRSWNSKTMLWAPEKIDYPLQGIVLIWHGQTA